VVQAKHNEDEIKEEARMCQKQCIIPRSLLHEDISAKFENWRTQAFKYLASHSLSKEIVVQINFLSI
jgi:hypothetical protein